MTRARFTLTEADFLRLLQGGRLDLDTEQPHGEGMVAPGRMLVPVADATRVVHVEHDHDSDTVVIALEWPGEVIGRAGWKPGYGSWFVDAIVEPPPQAEAPRRPIRAMDAGE